MKNKGERLKTFSVKKLLLTILCTVIVSVFIGSTIAFVGSIPEWIQLEVVSGMEEGSEALVELGNSYQLGYEQMEEKFKEDKVLYGEDYPAEEIFLMQLINIFSTNRIMAVYTMSVLIGIALGTIIYIVAIQNIKGIEIVIELFLAFVVLFILISFLNLGYQTIINKLIGDVNPIRDGTYYTYIYDIESNNILIPYTIVAAVIYAVNMVRQKIITNKLNKQLNTK